MHFKPLWKNVTPKIASECLQKYGHLVKWNNPNAHVMDLGCGEGSVTSKVLYPYAKDRIGKLTGTDISQDFIDCAKIENREPKIDYQLMDASNAEQMEKMKGKFDNIFSFYAAQWIPDQRTFSNGLREMLKPGGQAFIVHMSRTPVCDSFRRHSIEGFWTKYIPDGTGLVYYTDDPSGYIRRIVEDVGFKVELCEHEKKKLTIEESPDFIRALVSIHPHLDKIPPELLEDYYQDHIKYCIEKCTYLREPNVYIWPCETLTCILSK